MPDMSALVSPPDDDGLVGPALDMTERPHGLEELVLTQFRGRARRAIVRRQVFSYLAAATAVIALSFGFLVTLVDRRDFSTFGDGIWWAIVTLGTVGYGDIVPHTAWERVLGSVLIVVGVTFISF